VSRIAMSFEEMAAIREENSRLIAEGVAPYPMSGLVERVPLGITYAVEEGQLVRLFHMRNERAWYLCEAPLWALREALTWNDPNGDYSVQTPASDCVDLVVKQFGVQS
jgi:hypothetical protein